MADITYRDLRPDDLEDLTALVFHWSVVRQLGSWPWPPDPAFTQSRCVPFAGDGFLWGICRDDRLIGTVAVTNGDLGYMLIPALQGQGIMSRAARVAVDHAFTTQTRDVITGSSWHDNPGSYRVLQSLGFRHSQTRYVRSKARGAPTLVHHQRLTRATWERLRSGAD